MSRTYTASISMQQRDTKDFVVRVYAGVMEDVGDSRNEDFQFTVHQGETPEDLRDWLRMAFAAATEAI